jgi:hypothetical protein
VAANDGDEAAAMAIAPTSGKSNALFMLFLLLM